MGISASPDTTDTAGDRRWDHWLRARRHAVDAALSAHLKAVRRRDPTHSRLLEAVEYSLKLPGKRLRPILTLECCGVVGGDDAAAMPAAIAIEAIHTFSLIHDDLPAMDDDELRRGQPTNHKVYGEAVAVLAGDWLASEAARVVLEAPIADRRGVELVRTLSEATLAMIAGQAADIAGEQRAADGELVGFIHRHKTAALLEAACKLGAIAGDADASQLAAVGEYGRRLGVAFQIVDDVLDCTGTTEALGKTVGKDAGNEKQTYPAVHGVERSRAQAVTESESAIAALAQFDARADNLRELARFVVRRDH